jgi:hypothetical protein
MKRYGSEEYRYARPLADGLVADPAFRTWFIGRTVFREYADTSRLLHDEQMQRRAASAENWWRSCWTMSCACGDCRQRETDLLAIFQTQDDYRFALHVEVKSPGDRFGVDQAADYVRRAACWTGRERAPRTVLPHDAATTVIVCDRAFSVLNDAAISLFATVIIHEDVAARLRPYPNL